jgi:hypothetical protein
MRTHRSADRHIGDKAAAADPTFRLDTVPWLQRLVLLMRRRYTPRMRSVADQLRDESRQRLRSSRRLSA